MPSPEYFAVMLCAPRPNSKGGKVTFCVVPVPAKFWLGPIWAPCSSKSATLPVGDPAAAVLTVAITVMLCPRCTVPGCSPGVGGGYRAMLVVVVVAAVGPLITVWVSAGEVLPEKFESPL